MYGTNTHINSVRPLTVSEFDRIFKIVAKYEFALTLSNERMGFGFGVNVIDGQGCIMTFLDTQMPSLLFDGPIPTTYDAKLTVAYNSISGAINSPENLRLCEKWGLPKPQTVDHYRY